MIVLKKGISLNYLTHWRTGLHIFIVNLKLLIYCNFKPDLLIGLALSRLDLDIICSDIISILLQNKL